MTEFDELRKIFSVLNKFKTSKDFDYKKYFKGASPEEVFESYKELVNDYAGTFYNNEENKKRRNSTMELLSVNNDTMKHFGYKWDAQRKQELETTINKLNEKMYIYDREIKFNKELLKNWYKDANMMEKYIRKSGKQVMFVDLGAMSTKEFKKESQHGKFGKVVWIPSVKFLQLAYPLRNVENELSSVAHNANVINSGRAFLPQLALFLNRAGKAGVMAHQGRHRGYGNLFLRGAEAEMAVMLLDTERYYNSDDDDEREHSEDIIRDLDVKDIEGESHIPDTTECILGHAGGHDCDILSRITDEHELAQNGQYFKRERPNHMNRKKYDRKEALGIHNMQHINDEDRKRGVTNLTMNFLTETPNQKKKRLLDEDDDRRIARTDPAILTPRSMDFLRSNVTIDDIFRFKALLKNFI